MNSEQLFFKDTSVRAGLDCRPDEEQIIKRNERSRQVDMDHRILMVFASLLSSGRTLVPVFLLFRLCERPQTSDLLFILQHQKKQEMGQKKESYMRINSVLTSLFRVHDWD